MKDSKITINDALETDNLVVVTLNNDTGVQKITGILAQKDGILFLQPINMDRFSIPDRTHIAHIKLA